MCRQVSRAFAIFDDRVTDVIKCDWKIAYVKYFFIIFGKTNDAPQNVLQQLKSVSHFVHLRTDMIPTLYRYDTDAVHIQKNPTKRRGSFRVPMGQSS